MQAVNWNKLRDWAHKTSVEHGFYEDKPSNIHFLCLIVSELMEAVEADRKNHRAKILVTQVLYVFRSDFPLWECLFQGKF